MGVGVGVIAWVRKGVCGWNSLDCCLKVHVCKCRCMAGEGGVCVCVCVCVSRWVGGCDCVGVGVIACVRKGLCG